MQGGMDAHPTHTYVLVALLMEEKVGVQHFHKQLHLNLFVHALLGNAARLLEALHHTLAISPLSKGGCSVHSLTHTHTHTHNAIPLSLLHFHHKLCQSRIDVLTRPRRGTGLASSAGGKTPGRTWCRGSPGSPDLETSSAQRSLS